MTTTTTKSAEAPEMPIADRLEHCAKFTGLDAVRELLIEAAAAVRKRDAVVKLQEGELQDRALRPQAVPMTDEQVRKLFSEKQWYELGEYPFTWAAAQVIIRAAEAHHGITAQAKKEDA